MINQQVTSALIQTVGLFLPAWAIMVQIFARLMEKSDLSERPSMIPLFGVGLVLAFRSFNAITLAALSHLLSVAKESAKQGVLTKLEADAFLSLMQGSVMFSYLGLIVLVIAVMRFFERKDGAHVGTVALTGYAITNFQTDLGIGIVAWLMIILFVADLAICMKYWDSIKDWLDE